MDCKFKVYYLINLNQNHNRSGWWSKGWDNFGSRYEYNFNELRSKIHSLKITPNNQTKFPESEYYQMKLSCKKDEENNLLQVLSQLNDVNYIKLNEDN